MDALITGILSSPLAFVIVLLVVVFLVVIGRFFIYPELVDKKVLENAHKDLFAKYQALLEKEALNSQAVTELLTEGSFKELNLLVSELKALNTNETIKDIDRNLEAFIATNKDTQREVLSSLKSLEKSIEDIKSNGDPKSADTLRQLESISRDCTDIIRRHDVITGALLHRLTGDSSSVALKGLQ